MLPHVIGQGLGTASLGTADRIERKLHVGLLRRRFLGDPRCRRTTGGREGGKLERRARKGLGAIPTGAEAGWARPRFRGFTTDLWRLGPGRDATWSDVILTAERTGRPRKRRSRSRSRTRGGRRQGSDRRLRRGFDGNRVGALGLG